MRRIDFLLSLLFFSCSQAFVPRFSNKLSVVTTTSIHKRGNVSNGLHTHLSFQKYTPSIAHNGRALNRSRRYSTQIVTENLESMATKSLEFLIELFNIKALIRNVTQHFRTYTLLVVGVIATWRANLLLKWKAALSPTIEISKSTITDDSSRKIKQKPFFYSHPIRRSIDVWIFAAMFLYNYNRNKKIEKKDPVAYKLHLESLAKALTEKILDLGPTYIKLGQLLSTRVDLFPKEFITELSRLQDQVPSFSGDIAVKIIEEELKQPIDKLFDSFNKTSVAAASLGQVHVAYKNGEKLAVKVQRQGLKELFDMDLKNLKFLAHLMDKFDPKSDGADRSWIAIFNESQRLLYKEIDFKAEAYNSIRFKQNFENVPWVKVPEVKLNMSTTRVMTMEFVPGIKINNIAAIEEAGIDRKLLAKRSAESYLMQLCRHGYFHCDPHPGNVACDNVHGGRLIYYDFGMMDELQPNVKRGLVDLIFGVYENDVKEVCDALQTMGVLRAGIDRVSIEKVARVFLQEFARGIQGENWTSQLPDDVKAEIRRKRRLQLGADLFSLRKDVPFRFPPTFMFIFRAFTSLDGIGKGLDPKYDLVRLARPFLQELIDLKDGSSAITFLKSWTKKLGLRPIDLQNVLLQPRKIAEMSETMTKMEQGDLKIRVRVLESERAFQKMELVSQNLAAALGTVLSLNLAMLFSSLSRQEAFQLLLGKSLGFNGSNNVSNVSMTLLFEWLMRLSIGLSLYFGFQLPMGWIKVKSLEKKLSALDNPT